MIPNLLKSEAAVASAVGCICMIGLWAVTPTTELEDGTEEPLFQIETNFMDKLANKPYLHVQNESDDRPRGVPSSLRIVTVDLPQVRHAFSGGTCRVDASAVYPDGVAPDRKVKLDKNSSLTVEQKAWVRSLYKCMHDDNVGVEVMEAYTGDLNPLNLRMTRRIGDYQYDPGRYQETESETTASIDQIDAPWNQRAWMEEARWRLSGKVRFADSMEPAPFWSRWFGSVYRSSSSRQYEKPHAVIANGLALQRVPQSLRLLQRVCKDNHVPLYVVNDPRTWGGNTHASLSDALIDLRKDVKRRIIRESLQDSSAFLRGKVVGKMQADLGWKAKVAWKATRDTMNRRSHWFDGDWSQLDVDDIREKLRQRWAVQKVKDVDGNTWFTYTEGLVALAREVVDHEASKEAGGTATNSSSTGENLDNVEAAPR